MTTLPLRYPKTWLALGWCLVALAVTLSLMPSTALPKVGLSDKIEHAIGYAALTIWFAGIYPRSRYLLIAIALLVLGVAIEFAQGAMGWGRVSEVRDVFANACGVTAGIVAALLGLGRWTQHLERLLIRN